MEIQELLRSLLDQAAARTVYADTISADGRTIVPVAKVRCGFGGGSGPKEGQEKGGGAGGGFVAKPAGYIELTSGGTRFIPIVDPQDVLKAVALGILFGFVVGRLFD